MRNVCAIVPIAPIENSVVDRVSNGNAQTTLYYHCTWFSRYADRMKLLGSDSMQLPEFDNNHVLDLARLGEGRPYTENHIIDSVFK